MPENAKSVPGECVFGGKVTFTTRVFSEYKGGGEAQVCQKAASPFELSRFCSHTSCRECRRSMEALAAV